MLRYWKKTLETSVNQQRATEIFQDHSHEIYSKTDQMFAVLLVCQWILGIILALTISPDTWQGSASQTHIHVWLAVLLGGLLSLFPAFLAVKFKGHVVTRYVVTIAQALTSALLIHLSGGRIETHFHVFGSLAFIAFYRDLRLLGTFTLITALDHVIRGYFFPESIFGVAFNVQWRWLEHVGWVVFEDIFLIASIHQSTLRLVEMSMNQAELEQTKENIAIQVGALSAQRVELLENEHKLKVQNQELERVNNHKSEFLAAMSHELRTPLNAIIGYISLASRADDDQANTERDKDLKQAGESARSLLQLINDILDFSKIQAGQMDTFIEEFHIADAIEDCFGMAQLLSHKNTALTAKLELGDNLPMVQSDVVKIEQILTNLLGNAIKFTSAGSVILRAHSVHQGRKIRIEIEDTGCGIPADKLDGIFDSFKQVDGSTKRKFGGTGLGLAISKHFCDLLNIEVSVTSTVGRGTCFTLLVPVESEELKEASPEAVDSTNAKEIATTESVAAEPQKSVERPARPSIAVPVHKTIVSESEHFAEILCVLSDETFVELEGRIGKLPLKLNRVRDLSSCLDYCRSNRVWAIVHELAEATFEELAEVKSDPVLQGIPVIVCANSGTASKYQLSQFEYIQQPIQGEQLTEALFVALGAKKGEVLIVEDDQATRELFKKTLAMSGYQVSEAGTGPEAIAKLSKNWPQAIILDLLLPELDGFKILEQIQEVPALRKKPVVVVSGKVLTNKEKTLLREGAQLLLEKGQFEPHELSNHVNNVVGEIEQIGGRSILIVDDNSLNRDLFTRLFKTGGFEVTAVSSGQAAIDAARTAHFEAILMDLGMPDMDGFEAIEQLTVQSLIPETAIIACSAFTDQQSIDRALELGCEGYLTKPIDPDTLVSEVRSFVLASKIRRGLCQQFS